MKLFLTIAALMACVFAEEWTAKNQQEINDIRSKCTDEQPAFEEQNSFEETTCRFLRCVSERVGFFSTEKGFLVDRFAKQFEVGLGKDKVKKLAEDCIAKFPRGSTADNVHVFIVLDCVAGDHSKVASMLWGT